jgi:hypothetical protein
MVMDVMLGQYWKQIVFWTVAAIVVFWIVGTSDSFQGCIHLRKNDESYRAIREGVSIFFGTITRLRLHQACVGQFTDENEGAITALATVVVAGFTFTLWRATSDMHRVADKQRTEMERATGVARDTAKAAQDAANAANTQARVSLEELHRSHRAWVGISGEIEMLDALSFDPKIGVRTKIKLTFKNSGGSPAIGAIIICDPRVGPHPHPDPRTYAINIRPEDIDNLSIRNRFGLLILPDHTIESRRDFVVAPEQFETPNHDGVSLWLPGYIGYQDEFGKPHATTFLLRYVTRKGEAGVTFKGENGGQFERMGVGERAY